jgi:hypothetical protein
MLCLDIQVLPSRTLSTQEPVLYINALMNINSHGFLTEQGRDINPEGIKFCISMHVMWSVGSFMTAVEG